MALREIKEKVLKMRRAGMSYGQIRTKIKVSKSALSLWLRDMPLPDERIRELRDNNAIRIEKCRNTKANKKRERLDSVYKMISKEIGKLSKREIFLCGLFLYWGEGSKTTYTSVEITNTDPGILRFALVWLKSLGIRKEDIKVVLKIYKDTNEEEKLNFWSDTLGIKREQFRFYVKKSNQSDITYKTGYGQGTCSISYGNRDIYERVMQSLRYFKNYFL